jgi:hypothetical protein
MKSLLTDPKKIFLLDGIGALLTSFLLLVVVKHQTELFGVLPSACVKLSVIAFVFCLYSLTCHFLARENWRSLLKVIAFANITYCVTTVVLLTEFYEQLTPVAYTYFSIELGIITGLSIAEFRLASRP